MAAGSSSIPESARYRYWVPNELSVVGFDDNPIAHLSHIDGQATYVAISV
ncbi:MAG TPA: hypothetical protein VJ870_00465 [Amycolatopsis sp.]|nr:hypothetical protein [Amycolatopsis sp.]